jgi:hypothetical protein
MSNEMEKLQVDAARKVAAAEFQAPRLTYSWKPQNRTHKGQGWSIFASSMQHVGHPTIADGMTRDNALFLTLAAVEYHGLVAKLAELRRRQPDAPVLAQLEELIDGALAVIGPDSCAGIGPAGVNSSVATMTERLAQFRRPAV